MDNPINKYLGRIPACGVFCGGCPMYTRQKKACPGAEINSERCDNCKSYHLCCKSRNITHCYQCSAFPCYRFNQFAKSWLKYGQDLINNQNLLKTIGNQKFIQYYNSEDMKFTVHPIKDIKEKRTYYPLLLDADPDIDMLEKYLENGDLFAFHDGETAVGVIVVLPLSDSDCEIKNIAVLPDRQKQGIGRYMIRFINENYPEHFKKIYVGTADTGIDFYEKCGFQVSHIIKNFFTDNYPEPIYDSGKQCIDMTYLVINR